MVLRLFPQDSLEQVEMIARPNFVKHLNPEPALKDPKAKTALGGLKPQKECLEAFTESMGAYERIRTCSPDLPLDLYQAAARADKYIGSFLTDFTSGKESFEALIQSRGAKPWL